MFLLPTTNLTQRNKTGLNLYDPDSPPLNSRVKNKTSFKRKMSVLVLQNSKLWAFNSTFPPCIFSRDARYGVYLPSVMNQRQGMIFYWNQDFSGKGVEWLWVCVGGSAHSYTYFASLVTVKNNIKRFYPLIIAKYFRLHLLAPNVRMYLHGQVPRKVG